MPLLLSLIQPLILQIDLMHFWPGLRPLRPRVQYQWLFQLKLLENCLCILLGRLGILPILAERMSYGLYTPKLIQALAQH